jgi:hypothetical protein
MGNLHVLLSNKYPNCNAPLALPNCKKIGDIVINLNVSL